MRFADILKMCFDSLSRRKGRTILTVLGVFIGCTSIIVMVSINGDPPPCTPATACAPSNASQSLSSIIRITRCVSSAV